MCHVPHEGLWMQNKKVLPLLSRHCRFQTGQQSTNKSDGCHKCSREIESTSQDRSNFSLGKTCFRLFLLFSPTNCLTPAFCSQTSIVNGCQWPPDAGIQPERSWRWVSSINLSPTPTKPHLPGSSQPQSGHGCLVPNPWNSTCPKLDSFVFLAVMVNNLIT